MGALDCLHEVTICIIYMYTVLYIYSIMDTVLYIIYWYEDISIKIHNIYRLYKYICTLYDVYIHTNTHNLLLSGLTIHALLWTVHSFYI